METDDDLAIGEFGIATRMVQGGKTKRGEELPEPQAEPGATMIYKPRSPLTEGGPAPERRARAGDRHADMDGKRREVDKRRVVIGRSKDCDIQLADPNFSRRHAELRQEGSAYWLDRPRLDERLPGERPPHCRARSSRAAT